MAVLAPAERKQRAPAYIPAALSSGPRVPGCALFDAAVAGFGAAGAFGRARRALLLLPCGIVSPSSIGTWGALAFGDIAGVSFAMDGALGTFWVAAERALLAVAVGALALGVVSHRQPRSNTPTTSAAATIK